MGQGIQKGDKLEKTKLETKEEIARHREKMGNMDGEPEWGHGNKFCLASKERGPVATHCCPSPITDPTNEGPQCDLNVPPPSRPLAATFHLPSSGKRQRRRHQTWLQREETVLGHVSDSDKISD